MAAKSPCRTRCAAFQKPMKSPPKREPSDSSWKYLIRLQPACAARHIAHKNSNVFCNGRIDQVDVLLAERIAQLSAELLRHRLVIDAVIVGQRILRHPERAEHDVPERKSAGEIGVAALCERGVVPAVE